MERQLILLDDDNAGWRLDEDTKRQGRLGLQRARAALREAARRPAA